MVRGELPAITALLVLVTGCAGPGSPAADSGRPKVDRVVLAVEPPIRETNELRNLATPHGWQLMPMYENLLGIDPETGKKVPNLATSWTIEPGGQAVRVQLKKSVRFHGDWGEFTANDLLHQPAEMARDDSLTGSAPFWREALDRIQLVNDHEAVFHLKRADGNFFDYISDQIGGNEINSRKHFETINPPTMVTGPVVGTAPYQLKHREQGSFIRFERVPYDHWRMTPDFPEFEFRFVREASTRLAALLTGEVHLAGLPEDLLQQAQRQSYKVVQGRVPALRSYLNFYCCNFVDRKDPAKGYTDPESPLTDIRVRRLLSKAINRDELNKAFFGGKGQVLYNNPFHPIRQGWNPEWERRFQDQYGYDPAAARGLLAQAGYGPEKPLTVNIVAIQATAISGSLDVMDAIAGFWRAVGVNVEMVQMDSAQLTPLGRAGRITRHVVMQGTNSNQWVGYFNQGTSLQRSPTAVGGVGPELWEPEQLMLQIASTLDEKKHEQLWRQIGDLLFEQHHWVPLFWHPVEVVYNSQIVADWVLPGSITGSWTHAENIKAAR